MSMHEHRLCKTTVLELREKYTFPLIKLYHFYRDNVDFLRTLTRVVGPRTIFAGDRSERNVDVKLSCRGFDINAMATQSKYFNGNLNK